MLRISLIISTAGLENALPLTNADVYSLDKPAFSAKSVGVMSSSMRRILALLHHGDNVLSKLPPFYRFVIYIPSNRW